MSKRRNRFMIFHSYVLFYFQILPFPYKKNEKNSFSLKVGGMATVIFLCCWKLLCKAISKAATKRYHIIQYHKGDVYFCYNKNVVAHTRGQSCLSSMLNAQKNSLGFVILKNEEVLPLCNRNQALHFH